MDENKIPTAEIFLNETQESFSIWGDLLKDKGEVFYEENVKTAMVEFAKLHVEAALSKASKEVKTKNVSYNFSNKTHIGGMEVTVVDKESIINAYPLENIK
jgi:hypothetical protein